MGRGISWNVIKAFSICLLVIVMFYLCLRFLQIDVFNHKRYELPEGPSIKVHQSDKG